MKYAKKLMAVALALSLTMCAVPQTAGAGQLDGKVSTVVRLLHTLGLLPDDGNGLDDAFATRPATRAETALMQLRLMGLEDEANTFQGEDTFADTGVPQALVPVLAYLKATPSLGWEADAEGKFDPDRPVDVETCYKAMLAALGYPPDSLEGAVGKARSIGAYVKPVVPGSFMVNDLASAAAAAMNAERYEEETRLVDTMAQQDAELGGLLDENGLLYPNGSNLAPNAGFETDGGWQYFDGSEAVFSRAVAFSEGCSLRLTEANGGVKSGTLAVQTGAAYSLSAWVYGRVNVMAALYDAEGNWLSNYQNIMDGGEPGRWQKLEDYIIIDDPAVGNIDITFTPADVEVYIDQVRLVQTKGTPLARSL